MSANMFSASDVVLANERIKGTIHVTPILTSSSIDKLCGKHIFFKSEHLQKTGSFKARGALNAVKALHKSGNTPKAVITHSSGNHGQALAWAAGLHNIPCTVVVPDNAPISKIKAMKEYGANVVVCAPEDREKVCEKMRDELHAEQINPYNDYRVMGGQGTIALEFIEQVPELDALVIAVGGGGFCSGSAVFAKRKKPSIKVFCATPEHKNLEESLAANERLWDPETKPLTTVADGIRVLRVGEYCFPFIHDCCEKTVLVVSDEEIIEALKLIYSRLKQAVEPTAAVSLAAVLKYPDVLKPFNNIGLVLCGGNVDLDNMPF